MPLIQYRQRLTLPQRRHCSTISAPRLNLRVRYGYGCVPGAIATGLPFTAQCISFGQALGQLVPVSLTCYHAYTPGLSTRCSLWGLTRLSCGKSYLRVCFALRCFQRLSYPDIATQLCPWRDNWCTIGLSIPVLSY